MAGGSVKKYLLTIAGSLSLAVGVVGIVVPVLPTTPFLLLSAFCYLRSSRRLYDWLINHGVLGRYTYNYMNYRAVSRSIKVGTLIFLWAALTVSIVVVPNLYIRLFLVAVGIGVSIHLLALKTLRKDDTTQRAS